MQFHGLSRVITELHMASIGIVECQEDPLSSELKYYIQEEFILMEPGRKHGEKRMTMMAIATNLF